MTARTPRLALVAASSLLVGACVVPASTDADYRTDASEALESASSETRTAQLALQQWLDGNMPDNYADVVVTDSEGAMGPIQVSFGGVDPPDRTVDTVRDHVTDQLSDAESAIAEARIALRRGDRAGVRESVTALDKIASALEESGGELP